MPRHTDPKVEARILRAARSLWRAGGEHALSMRAVAKAAHTNTPAVYRRFRNREDILRALVIGYQEEMQKLIEPCGSLQEVAREFLEFALRKPREYELMTSGLLARMSKTRPNIDFLLQRCAEWFGGVPADHRSLIMSTWPLVHGLALLKISGTLREQDFPIARMAVEKAIDVLIDNAEKLRAAGRPEC